jgi:hypothetical protein
MKRIGLGLGVWLLLLATVGPLQAQGAAMAGVTDETCTGQGQIAAITVTPLLAYASGNAVGSLITVPAISRTGQSGVLQSVRLNIKSVQTSEFDIYQFQSPPTATFIDRMSPTLVGNDIFLVRPPIQLTGAYSDFGAMTVYGTDAITGARKGGSAADYFLIITKGAPTFATPSDVQFCVTYFFNF